MAPRQQWRGLIETIVCATCPTSPQGLHVSNGVASLKRCGGVGAVRVEDGLHVSNGVASLKQLRQATKNVPTEGAPRQQWRGLIETGVAPGNIVLFDRLHVSNGVASLKH